VGKLGQTVDGIACELREGKTVRIKTRRGGWSSAQRQGASRCAPTKNKTKITADKNAGTIIIDDATILTGIPKEAWEYKLGNRSALEWVLDQYKESTPSDPTIAEKFNTYKFADYKKEVIELLKKGCTVSVATMKIVREMEKKKNDREKGDVL
jgi:predicted helicase